MNGVDPKTNSTIYHTDIIFGLLDRHAMVYLDAFQNKTERAELVREMSEDGRKIIELTEKEMRCFCANVVQVKDLDHKELCVLMSE